MPDESTASTEHALIQEITAPLATLPDDPVPDVADVDFPIALRGYDRLAVDAYVRRTSQLVAELQATHSPEAAVRRALERVGEEVSGILKRAHDTAAQITAQSRSEAEDRLEAAREEAAEITAGAERRLRELDAETDRIWSERHRIVEDARALAQQLLELARVGGERFPAAEELEADAVRASERPATELFDEEHGRDDSRAVEDAAGPAHEPGSEPLRGDELGPAGAAMTPTRPRSMPPLRRPEDDQQLLAAQRRTRSMRLIDALHLGRARVIGCWQVGDVLVDPGPSSCLPTLLEALGDERPRALLLTHIHLDHAGRERLAGRALAGPRGLRARARRAAPGRPVAAARERAAALRRGHGPSVGRDGPGP